MATPKYRSFRSSRLAPFVQRVIAPCLGLALVTVSLQAQAQIKMVSPNGLAFTEPQSVAQYGGLTALGGRQDGLDTNGDGVGDDYRGGVYLYEWGNLRLNYVPRGPEFMFAFLGHEVRLSNTWLAASAPGYSVTAGTGAAGAVLLSKKSNGAFGPLSYLVKDERIPAHSGMSIAVSDTQLVIGSPNGTVSSGAGAAFVFSFDASRNAWGSPIVITPSDGHVGDKFGASVAIDGNRIVVGAPEHDDDLGDSNAAKGRAYVFDRTGSQWLQTLGYTSFDATSGARYGDKVDVHLERMIVSAPFAAGIGLVQILEREGGAWRSRYLDHRSALSVAIQGDKAVIGLSLYPSGTLSANRVRSYRSIGRTWSAYGGMVGKDPADSFGESVDIHNDQIAVSARGVDDKGRSSVGAAFLENFWATSSGL
jgi:hypothetical protein